MNPEPDTGMATVWAAGCVAVLAGVLLVAIHLGSAVATRHRAEAAADLGALAAAGSAVHGSARACSAAAGIADAAGGRIVRCTLEGWNALIEVEIPVPVALPGTGAARGRAMAGPVPIEERP